MKISRVWAVYFSPTGNVKRSDKPDRKKIVRGTVSAARAVEFYTSGQPEVCQGI